MKATEYLDVLGDKGNKTGDSKSYDEVHEKGFIHRTVHVWILNSKGELLIQKRAKNRRAYPGHWDISTAGHISAGQTSLEAAQREVEEELGIKISESKFECLFSLESHSVLNSGTYVNNEFQDVYIVHTDLDPTSINLEKDGEVEQIRFVSIPEFKDIISGKSEPVVPHKEEYEKLLNYINGENKYATRK